MNPRRRKWIIVTALAVVVVGLAAYKQRQLRWMIAHALAQPLPVSYEFTRFPVYQPSGIVADIGRGTLIAVSDKGQLVEMDEQFQVLQRVDLDGDLESVAVHPETGTLFVAYERTGSVVEYDLKAHRILRTLSIDFASHPAFRRGLRRNNGVEGVAISTDRGGMHSLFVAVEAFPARIVRLSVDLSSHATEAARRAKETHPKTGLKETVEVSAVYDVGLTRISDVAFDAQTGLFVLVSAGERVLVLTDLQGHVSQSYRLPGKKPEGICLLSNGDALVVDDTGGAWVLHHAAGFLKKVAQELPRSPTKG